MTKAEIPFSLSHATISIHEQVISTDVDGSSAGKCCARSMSDAAFGAEAVGQTRKIVR
jgi:hypothetical protein